MKAKQLLAALLLMVSTGMAADETKALTISYSGGEQSVALPTVKKITFQDNRVIIQTSEGEHSFPISILDKITFTTFDSATAIETLPEQQEGLTYENGVLAIKGDGMLRIFNTSGALVNIANVKEGAYVTLQNLPAGVYIVRMGDKTIKVRK